MTREEAIKIIEVAKAEVEWEAPLDYQIAFDMAIEALKQPTQRWIPVTERLPEVRQGVIMSTKNWTGEGCYWETTKHHVIWKEYGWNATYWDDEVVAWMPMPEPYKEVE